jgi:hypothetical protein
MRRWGLFATILLAGCLPQAIVDPSTCKIDPSLEGIWLAKGDLLEQCMHGDVEYGPGTQQSIVLVKDRPARFSPPRDGKGTWRKNQGCERTGTLDGECRVTPSYKPEVPQSGDFELSCSAGWPPGANSLVVISRA